VAAVEVKVIMVMVYLAVQAVVDNFMDMAVQV
jgi:hypothetical protein